MKRNEELFRKVADHIEAQPEHYDQEMWWQHKECGTTACIAGWGISLTKQQSLDACAKRWDRMVQTWNGNPADVVRDEAAECFGLTDSDARLLFHASWAPHDGLSVPDALRKIGEGASIEDVSA